MFGVTVRDHAMVAHSLRGRQFGPAQALHGATYVVEATFRAHELDPDGVVVDIGLASSLLADVVGGLTYRNLDEDERFADTNTTTEVLARWVADQLGDRVTAGALGDAGDRLDSLVVTLHESPDAWVSFERPCGARDRGRT